MISCSRCGRSLRNPVRIAGLVFGSKCARAVDAAVEGTRAARTRRRRAAALEPARFVDPRQMELELQP